MRSARELILVLSPTVLFIGTIVLLNLLPGLYIWLFQFQEGLYIVTTRQKYTTATELYLIVTLVFLAVFAVSRYIAFAGGAWFSTRCTDLVALKDEVVRGRARLFTLPTYLAAIGVLSIWIYFAMGGYEKLLNYGSDMDSWEFRLIGYDDRSRFLIAALEAARRVLLPYAALYFFVVRAIGVRFPRWLLAFLLFTQFVGAVVTLDRAPILLFFLMLIYVKLCRGASFGYLLRIGSIIFASIVLLGGLTTFIQYNLGGFSIVEVVTTGLDFFIHRTVVVPSIASIELSFHLFPLDSEKLLLAHSRLTALFGGTYVGSQDDLSVYVTPVGAVADIWRNFGFQGVVLVAFYLGWYFRRLDGFLRRSSPVMWIVGSFNVVSLCFYYIYGVFFSQGVIFQMILVYWLLFAESRLYQRSSATARLVAQEPRHA
jgi:hypothetical protein